MPGRPPPCSAPGISVNDAATTTTSTTAKVTPPKLGGELLYSTSIIWAIGAPHCCTVAGCCCAVLCCAAPHCAGCSAALLTKCLSLLALHLFRSFHQLQADRVPHRQRPVQDLQLRAGKHCCLPTDWTGAFYILHRHRGGPEDGRRRQPGGRPRHLHNQDPRVSVHGSGA